MPHPTATDPAAPKTDWTRLIPWGLLLIGVLVYINSLAGKFVFDDNHAIVQNLQIRYLWPLTHLLQSPRPLIQLTFAANYAIDGLNERGYHLVNMFIHIAAGLTLYGLIRRTLRLPVFHGRTGPQAPWFAATVALIFIVHPLQTQAVTYIVQRAESLAALFYLLTMYSFVRGVEVNVSRPLARVWMSAAVFCSLLGMATKPTLVTVPALVLLYDHVFVAGTLFGAIRKRPLFYLAMIATWSMLWSQGIGQSLTSKGSSVGFHTGMFTWQKYAMTQPGVILHYLRLSVWPHPLCLDYLWLPPMEPWRIIVPSLIVGALVLATAWLCWRRSWIGFAGAWFFIILSPTSSVVPVADMAVEHRMYLPLAAVIVLIVAGAAGLFKSLLARLNAGQTRRRCIAVAAVTIIAVPLAGATILRNRDYGNSITLWQSAIRARPGNARAHHNLGSSYHNQDMIQEAIDSYETAIALVPNYADAYNNLGKVCLDMGKVDQALSHFLRAVRIKPQDAAFHYNVGRGLMAAGDPDGAAKRFQDALDINPTLAVAHSNLGIIHLQKGRVGPAMQSFKRAIEIDPDLVYALYNIGKMMLDAGKPHDAAMFLERAAAVDQDDKNTHKQVLNNLGAALAQLGRREQAVKHLLDAVQIDPEYADAHANLGAVFLAGGRADLATRAYNQALRLQPDNLELIRRLAWIYATSPDPKFRDGDRALRLAQAANKASAKPNPHTLATIAAAYAELGRFQDAATTAKQARDTASTNGLTRLAQDLDLHIKRYEAGQPITGQATLR